MSKLDRNLTEEDSSAFCHKVSSALAKGWTLYGTPGYVFDGELEVQVKQFQLTTGLTPDGIAGVKTWIKINDADDIDTPRLDGESL